MAALARPVAGLRETLMAGIEQCGSVAELQAWVAHSLRPAYGDLELAWVEVLRGRYGERLAMLAGGGSLPA